MFLQRHFFYLLPAKIVLILVHYFLKSLDALASIILNYKGTTLSLASKSHFWVVGMIDTYAENCSNII
jgi:hypothetical protein